MAIFSFSSHCSAVGEEILSKIQTCLQIWNKGKFMRRVNHFYSQYDTQSYIDQPSIAFGRSTAWWVCNQNLANKICMSEAGNSISDLNMCL